MENQLKKVRATFKIDIDSEMEDVKENDKETLKYCLCDDLEELGVYNVNSCEILKNDIDIMKLSQMNNNKLTKTIKQMSDEEIEALLELTQKVQNRNDEITNYLFNR